MSDTYGPIPIPLPPPTDGVASTDPSLQYTLDYLKAFLNTDQNATAAWQVTGMFPGKPPVVGTHVFDPEEVEFKTTDLPALFAWRSDGVFEQLADDYRIDTDIVHLVWVYPLSTQQMMGAGLHAFANGLVKAIDTAIDRGRTPGWIYPKDPDPMAPVYGSLLGSWQDDWQFWVNSWKRRLVTLRARDGSVTNTYPAIELTCKLSENHIYDITRDPPYDVPDDKGPLITITDGDSGRLTDQGYANVPAGGPPPWTQSQLDGTTPGQSTVIGY